MDNIRHPKSWIQALQRSRNYVLEKSPAIPSLAFTLGSGLGEAIDSENFHIESEVSFSELPVPLLTSVAGHAGKWIIGRFKDQQNNILIQSGRLHPYEGWSELEWIFSYSLMASLGVKSWVFTNAVGGISNDLKRGDWLVIRDHINGMGWNPLKGIGRMESHLRELIPGGCESIFTDMSSAYDQELSTTLLNQVRKENANARAGIYYGTLGPSYETPAEIQQMKSIGADVVGMSLVAETIIARYLGIRVAALSSVTNSAAGVNESEISHLEVLEAGKELAPQARKIIHGFAIRYFGATKDS